MRSLLNVSLLLFIGTQSYAGPLTRLQEDMIQGSRLAPMTRQEMEKLKLVRLWSFDNKNLSDDQVMGSRLVNANVGNAVRPLYCPANNKVYAQFYGRGKIVSDETYFMSDLLQEVAPSSLDNKLYFSKKVYQKASELFSDTLPKLSPDVPERQNSKLTSAVVQKYQSHIKYSSSLVDVKEDQGEFKVFSGDYTFGGWFKPTALIKGQESGSMTLAVKYYADSVGDNKIKEWEIFTSGNVIYFHNYRDGNGPVALKYLSEDEAQNFRAKNSDLFGFFDYRDDVINARRYSYSPMIDRYLEPPILPSQKSDVNKPVPFPLPPPPPPPARDVPTPQLPGVIVGGIGTTAKEYTSNIDLKVFWWANTLGTCYDCAIPNRFAPEKHTEAWHYISFSVHLNDALGPYVDFWIVRDPNPALFGSSADYLRASKHMRWELNRKTLSFSNYNPIQFSHEVERRCKGTGGNSCVKSILEIGANSENRSYSGFMRGVYLSKKAFNEKEALDLAKRFYPDDSEGFCTYKKLPDVKR